MEVESQEELRPKLITKNMIWDGEYQLYLIKDTKNWLLVRVVNNIITSRKVNEWELDEIKDGLVTE